MSYFRLREQYRRLEIPVSGYNIEEKIDEIARMIRRESRQYHHANYLTDNFNENQRRILYALLCEITEKKTERKGWGVGMDQSP